MNEKYNENYTSHKPSYNCLKQATNEAMYYSYTNFSLNTSLTTNFMDICNISSQNFNFQQNSQNSVSTHQEQTDILIWDSPIIPEVEKNKVSDKIEAIEFCNKDFSPASYCSNVDLAGSDSFKQNQNIGKDMHNYNKFENDWCYSQKNPTYASCAQEKFTNYCSIQNNPGIDYVVRNCNYNDMFYENTNVHCRISNKNISNETLHENVYDYYDGNCNENQPFTENNHYISTDTRTIFTPVSNIDQQTDGSNEESDIVVEETDEEIDDFSKDQEGLSYCTSKCLICNITYKPFGTQFYFLTENNPLTMSTQKPVFQKLINIVGQISTTTNYLCSDCLGYINNIDHFQLKLEKFRSDLISKFKKTCQESKTQYEKRLCTQKRSHIKKLPRFKCKLCNKILCLKKYCLYHIKRHKNRGYLCDYCGKIYTNKKEFSLHCIQHKKKFCKKIDSFKCSNCSKIFRTKSNKKEHENYCLNILPFKCKQQYCDKKFASATKLKNHVKLKHDKKFIVICSICNIGFIKASDYKSHMVSHSTDKKYSCPKCHKNYKTLSNLNFHMKMHSENLPFNCHICKKGFMRKEYLEAHINNHNGVKNFNCPSCDKKFVSQKNLDAHLKYHEGTVKKNTCNICGKTVTSGFEEHLRIHNNLREFECEHCDMKFNTKGTLSKHVKKKHL